MDCMAYLKGTAFSWTTMEPQTWMIDDSTDRLDDPESDEESVHSDHFTDSEQSGEDEEFADKQPHSKFFLGKDKKTRWNLRPSCPNVYSKKRKTHVPGVKKMAKSAKTRIDSWKLFFPDTIIELIVKCTNKYLAKLRLNCSQSYDYRETDVGEILALLGILYMAGVKKAQYLDIKELWETDGTGLECFEATMSMERFLLLVRALRFSNINDLKKRKKVDNLAPIRQVVEEFVSRCKGCYEVGDCVTLDEMLEAFKGKCRFRQYIANKPAKYGIKIYALTDARVFYTYNLEIYSGKQPNGPYKLDNSASAVAKRLAKPILNTGRNITMDSYFTSIPLALELLECNTTVVGVLLKTEKEIPPSFLDVKKRTLHSSCFGFLKNGVLVSYKPTNKNKNILVFSTLHKNMKLNKKTDDASKPEIISFYNLTKRGVDIVDEMKSLYSVPKIGCRWPLTVFFSLLDIGGINCQIIFKLNTKTVEDRRIFLKNLALDLMKTHCLVTAKISVSPLDKWRRIRSIAGVDEVDATESVEIAPVECCEKAPEECCETIPVECHETVPLECRKTILVECREIAPVECETAPVECHETAPVECHETAPVECHETILVECRETAPVECCETASVECHEIAPVECREISPVECCEVDPMECCEIVLEECCETAPMECHETAQVECHETAQVECRKTAPVEYCQTVPVECHETAPVECRETAPVECRETAPVECRETAPVEWRKTTPTRCYYCPVRKNKKTKKICSTCERYICGSHTSYLCSSCT